MHRWPSLACVTLHARSLYGAFDWKTIVHYIPVILEGVTIAGVLLCRWGARTGPSKPVPLLYLCSLSGRGPVEKASD